ncbi:MAG: GuaB3 family IMP dehydrogenase-related protein [Candidatus Caenarcaniphilales bacterium]|nr:GuaB3 family IMP dehydrogenase-related protein [Candidatus Caenarcaniphilales bacterium]
MSTLETNLRRNERLRRTYGFDEISLSPSGITIDPHLCVVTTELGKHKLSTPLIASAMDSVVSPRSAVSMGEEGVLGVLNLQGLWCRYEDAESRLEEIANAPDDRFVSIMQSYYSEPVKEDLIAKRIDKMKKGNYLVAVSSVPQEVNRLEASIAKAGADFLFVQSTVTSTRHVGKEEGLSLAELCKKTKLTVVAGNCSSYNVALDLMETGIAGLLVGIGPGAACTSRGVLGVGVPMATAVMDCCDARDVFEAKTGQRVAVIADGGIVVSGDVCKAIACGADAVMMGSPFAKAKDAPGRGFHWGMATPSPVLPRGTRIKVGTVGTYEQIVHGPASLDNGFHNFIGALKTSMGTLGAKTIKEMQNVDVIVAPSVLSEGKVYQHAQKLGMGMR